jgi:hypothetical protein
MNIGEQSSTGILTCQDLVSRRKIKWTEFDPPLTGGGGNQNLAGVLATGNDANAQDVVNVGKMTMSGGGGDVGLQTVDSITGVSNLECQNMVTTFATALESNVGDELTMGTSGGSGGIIQFDPNGAQGSHAINGASETNRCVLTNCDFTSATNTFPTSIDDDTLGDVMSRDNTASTTLNMNGELITNCQTIGTNEVATPLIQFSSTVGTLLNGSNNPGNPTVCNNLDFVSGSGNIFPASVAGDLEATLQLGDDANNQNIQGVNILTAVAVDSGSIANTGICSTGSLLTSSVSVQCNTIAESPAIVEISSGVTGGQAELDLSGRPGSVGQDTFIRGDTGTDSLGAVKNTRCLNLDLTDSTNRLPTDREQFEWGAYIEPSVRKGVVSDNDDWKYFGDDFGPQFGDNECYAVTKATTDPNHNRQLIKVTFNVAEFGWGNIMIGLDKANLNGTSPTELTAMAFSTKIDGKGIQAADRQKIGQCTMHFVVDNLPTDGTRVRIYPKVKTDFPDQGKVSIQMGPGIDHDGPTAALVGAVIIEGGPVPAGYRVYTGV